MEPNQKVSWYQIALPLGVMVAVFVFIGSQTNSGGVRVEAATPKNVCDYMMDSYHQCHDRGYDDVKCNITLFQATQCYADPNLKDCYFNLPDTTNMICPTPKGSLAASRTTSSLFSGASSGSPSSQSANQNMGNFYSPAAAPSTNPSFYNNPSSSPADPFADYDAFSAASEAADRQTSPGVYPPSPSNVYNPYTPAGLTPPSNSGPTSFDTSDPIVLLPQCTFWEILYNGWKCYKIDPKNYAQASKCATVSGLLSGDGTYTCPGH